MSNDVFADSRRLMAAFGLPTGRNIQQADLYLNLVDEEYNELTDAYNDLTVHFLENNGEISLSALIEVADGIIDSMVVLAGLGHSLGLPMQELWDEVLRSNLSKLLPDGSVLLREDGKVMKGPDYSPPNLGAFIAGL